MILDAIPLPVPSPVWRIPILDFIISKYPDAEVTIRILVKPEARELIVSFSQFFFKGIVVVDWVSIKNSDVLEALL